MYISETYITEKAGFKKIKFTKVSLNRKIEQLKKERRQSKEAQEIAQLNCDIEYLSDALNKANTSHAMGWAMTISAVSLNGLVMGATGIGTHLIGRTKNKISKIHRSAEGIKHLTRVRADVDKDYAVTPRYKVDFNQRN